MTRVIVLDPGHGGTDPGALGNGLRESNLVLRLALKVRDKLNNGWTGHRVVMTRTNDTFISLGNRVIRSNTENAHVFVSFHKNAFTNNTANGFESYRRPNANAEHVRLQKVIHDRLARFYTGRGLRDRGRKAASFQVIRDTRCPVVLLENLFITNTEILNFNNTSFEGEVARLIAEGIAEFLGLARRTSTGGNSIGNTHTVRAGETLWSISRQHNTTVAELRHLNNLPNDTIRVGQVLQLSTSSTTHFFPATATVSGSIVDTLNSIQVDSSMTNRRRIAQTNGITNYTGSVSQNNTLLSLLRQGKLVRP